METAADLLKSEPHQSVYTIPPAASVFEALKLNAPPGNSTLVRTEWAASGRRAVPH